MHRVDPSGMRLATEIEWRHRGYTVKIDTVSSGGRRCSYDIFAPDDSYVGGAKSLREAEEVIDAQRVHLVEEAGEDAMTLLTDRMVQRGWYVEHDDPKDGYRIFVRNGDESGDAMLVRMDREGFAVQRYSFEEGEGPLVGFPWTCFAHLVTPTRSLQMVAAEGVADTLTA